MATNWSLAEGAKVILEKDDMATLAELVKKFPITSVAIQAVGAGNEGNLMFLLEALPIHVTMRKVESSFKDMLAGVSSDADEDEEEVTDEEVTSDEEEEEPAPKKRGRKPLNKSKDEKNAEHRERAKMRKSEEEAEEEAEELDVDEETGEVDYSAMTAVELYKLCKERGIAARAKRSTKEYIELLKKADEEAMVPDSDEDEDDDDWGDDDDAPMNPPADEDEEEDDDDWDI